MSNYKEKDVTEVVPKLWLGNYKSAIDKRFLEIYKIKYIITVMDNFDNKFKYDNITYISIPIRDKQVCSKNMIEIFDMVNDFIFEALKKKESVLVHCKKGHHRSAAIVASFLIKYYKMNYISSVLYINMLRKYALRRDTCMSKWLFKYFLFINNIENCNGTCKKIGGIYLWSCQKDN